MTKKRLRDIEEFAPVFDFAARRGADSEQIERLFTDLSEVQMTGRYTPRTFWLIVRELAQAAVTCDTIHNEARSKPPVLPAWLPENPHAGYMDTLAHIYAMGRVADSLRDYLSTLPENLEPTAAWYRSLSEDEREAAVAWFQGFMLGARGND